MSALPPCRRLSDTLGRPRGELLLRDVLRIVAGKESSEDRHVVHRLVIRDEDVAGVGREAGGPLGHHLDPGDPEHTDQGPLQARHDLLERPLPERERTQADQVKHAERQAERCDGGDA